MASRRLNCRVAVTVTLAAFLGPIAKSQQSPEAKGSEAKAVHLIGLAEVKDNAKGTLRVDSGQLHFVHNKTSTDISTSSIEDVVTGADSQKAVGKTIGLVSMAAPYGGGRFLSLFRKKIDTLTVKYRDANGGIHGVIFTMPAGSAEGLKGQLVAQGAHTSIPQASAADVKGGDSATKEPKQ